jgi:hypothetical protein
MSYFHQELAAGKWFTLSLAEQLANVGSEFERAVRWKKKGDVEQHERACERMLELLDLTLADPRWQKARRLKEVARLREILCDAFYGENLYGTVLSDLQKYFLYFGIAARAKR